MLFVLCLFYFLYQGGKLAFMLFIIITALCSYFIICRWNGISQLTGVRNLSENGHEPFIQAGAGVTVQLQLKIPGYWPIPYVKIKETITGGDGEEHVIESLGIPNRKRIVELSYRTSSLRRGFYQFDEMICSTEDVFGLFKKEQRLGIPTQLAVMPQKIRIRDWRYLSRMLMGVNRQSNNSYRETAQFKSVREFVAGDRPSIIHWNATAKTGTWKSREFERESHAKLIVVLDRNSNAYSNKDHFELAISTAASLLDYAISRGVATGMLSVGSDRKYFEPKSNANHGKVLMNHLISVEPNCTDAIADVLKNHGHLLSPDSFFIIISPHFGNAMMPLVTWTEQRRMKICHMWIAPEASTAEREEWSGRLRRKDVLGYPVTSIEGLALALEGA
ncbi:MAG: hypothetical protein K0R57_661 [Paenibacillaceae bacterium]|jgi:uncharacterized protein (DUF58 family)|nr:hypothetical protein [Paenibacillaceae bacterium]